MLMAAASVALSQKPAPCTGPEWHRMDFLIGRWTAAESDIAGRDTTRIVTGRIATDAVLNGCALQGTWQYESHGTTLFHAIVISGYDADKSTWRLAYADDLGNYQTYDGQPVGDSGMAFVRARMVDGKPALARVTSFRTTNGYRQTIERSLDNGATWILRAFVDFTRSPY
jgi:hypothetical protein